jgi:hypothetical protein
MQPLNLNPGMTLIPSKKYVMLFRLHTSSIFMREQHICRHQKDMGKQEAKGHQKHRKKWRMDPKLRMRKAMGEPGWQQHDGATG